MKRNNIKIVAAISAILLATGIAGGAIAIDTADTGNFFNNQSLTALAADANQNVQKTYSVDITLMKYHQEGASMGNESMKKQAHIVVATDGSATIQIDMQKLEYPFDRTTKSGYLGSLKKLTNIKYDENWNPVSYDTIDATVLDEYTDIYDDFNDPNSQYADKNVSGKWYPKKLSLPIDFANREGDINNLEDDSEENDITVQVYVPIMESIMPNGGGTQLASLAIDYSSLNPPITTTTADPNVTTSQTKATTITQKTDKTEKATTSSTSTNTNSKLDPKNLADGKYQLQAEMVKINKKDHSMSNDAINHTVQLDVQNGEYYITMQFKGLHIYNKFGYLQDLYYYKKGYGHDKFGNPTGDVEKAEVISTYDTIDQYNEKNHILYPQQEKFPLVDKGTEEYVPLRVFVPIMDAISKGTGTQNVLMKLDWSSLKEIKEDVPLETDATQSDEFDYTDPKTNVKLHAEQGVLPDDATATVDEITSGKEYELARVYLDDPTVYAISTSSDLNGQMQISLPIKSGLTNPTVYRLENGKKTKIKGTAKDNYYNFSVKETGTFAIGADKSNSSSTGNRNSSNLNSNRSNLGSSGNYSSGNGNSNNNGIVSGGSGATYDTVPTSPSTGKNLVGVATAGLAVAAGLAVIYINKRRKK